MRKSELIATVAQLTGKKKKVVNEVLDTIVGVIRQTVKQGDKIRIAGLGTFSMADKAARRVINPITKEEMFIPAGKRIKFSPSADFKAYINDTQLT